MSVFSQIPVWIVYGSVFAILAAFIAFYLIPKIKQAVEYINNVKECGYLPPPPNKLGLFWLDILCRLILFVNVGRVKVEGTENLAKLDGKPYLITPNHPHFADVAVMPYVLGARRARYMAAKGVFTFGGGLGALIFGPMGAFAVDLTKGKGGPAKDASVEILSTNQILVMFPEGWAYLDGVMENFKKGAVTIAKETQARISEDVYIVPTFLRYGKYPGSWIRKIPPPLEYFILLMLFPIFRRGVTVVFGEPIPASSLPEDDYVGTELLEQKVRELDPLS